MVKRIKTFEVDPPNSPELLKDKLGAWFICENWEKSNLLSDLINMIGKEKEEYGGLAAMEKCKEEYFASKGLPLTSTEYQPITDFEDFLFSSDRNGPIIILDEGKVIQSATGQSSALPVTPKIQEKLKGPDSPSSTEALVTVDPEVRKNLKGLESHGVANETSAEPANKEVGKILERPKHLSTGDVVVNKTATGQSSAPPAIVQKGKQIKGADGPPNSEVVMATNPHAGQTSDPLRNTTKEKILKVKIYMGSGWENDFPQLTTTKSPPKLFVKLNTQDLSKGKVTKSQPKSWTPNWGEEFEFPLSNLKDDKLFVEVYASGNLWNTFAGKVNLKVSDVRQGIRAVKLEDEKGGKCNSTCLLVRFIMFG